MSVLLLIIELIGPAIWLVGFVALFLPTIRASWRRGYAPSTLGVVLWLAIASGLVLIPLRVVASIDGVDALNPLVIASWVPYIALFYCVGPFERRRLFRLRPRLSSVFAEAEACLARGYEGSDGETSYRWALRHFETALRMAPESAQAVHGAAAATYYLARLVPPDEGLELLSQAEAGVLRSIAVSDLADRRNLLAYIREYRQYLLEL